MKNNKLRMALMLLIAFCVSTMNAQDKATEIKKEAPKSNKEIKKVKDQKGGSFTDAVNTAKGKPDQVKKDALEGKENMKDDIKKLEDSYAKRIEATKDPKEQARLKEEMNEKMQGVKKSGNDAVINTSGGPDSESSSGAVKPKEKPNTDAQVNKGKPSIAIKEEKVSNVKEKISTRRKSLDNRKEMVKRANVKVASEREKLDRAKDEGILTEEEISAKEAKLVDAEAKIKKLEASIMNAEKKYSEKEEKLSSFVKDQN